MGYLCVTRRDGESIRLTIDPGVDIAKLLQQLLRDGITIHIAILGQGLVRIGIDAPKQVGIFRHELLESGQFVGEGKADD